MKRYGNLTWLAAILSVLFIIGSGVAEAQKEKTNIKGCIAFDFPSAPEAKIEVNLSGKLFSLIAKSVKQEPEITEIIAMVEGVYIRGYNSNVTNLDGMIRYYENKLKEEKWELIAKVKEKNEMVQVRLLLEQEKVRGLFVIVAGTEEIILVNIFGHIDFEKIDELLENLDEMNIDFEMPQLKDLKIDAESKQK